MNQTIRAFGKDSAIAIRNDPDSHAPRVRQTAALVVFVALAIASVLIVVAGYNGLSLATLLRYRMTIDDFVSEHRWAAFASFVALYAAAVALSIPGAAVLTVSGGFLFGALIGGFGAFIGALTGAAAIFLIARTALGGLLAQRAGRLAEKLADGFRRDAFWYLLFLRLVPLFPFWLVNIAPALFGVRFIHFIGATAIGIAPLTFAFAFFGAGLDSAVATQASRYEACLAANNDACAAEFDASAALTPELLAALAVLGVLSLLPVAVKRWRAARERAASEEGRSG